MANATLTVQTWLRLILGVIAVGVLAVFGVFFLLAGMIVILLGILAWQISRWFRPKRAQPHRNMRPGAKPAQPTVEGEFKVIDESRIEIIPPPRRPEPPAGSG